MSQKTKRGSASLDEKDKMRTDSPVKDMKKKAAANAEKERVAAEKAAAEHNNGKPAPAANQTSGKPTSAANQNSGKTAPAANQNSGSKAAPAQISSKSAPAAAQNSGKTTPTAVQNSGKTTTANPATVQNLKDIPLPVDKPKDDLKAEKAEKPKQTVAPEPAKPPSDAAKQNGSGKDGRANSNAGGAVGVSDVALNRNGRAATPDAFNGTTVSRSPELEDELRIVEEDELFPELTYDDTSDNDASGDGGRSVTRRSQVKAARTPETPRPVAHKPASGDDKAAEVAANADPSKGDTKLLKLRDEYTASPMKLRSSDRSTPEPVKPADGVKAQVADEKKPDDVKDIDDIKNDKEDDDDAERETKNDCEASTKRDTNFSKSRIKISPYRRSTRLQDSMLANYTGNNTTMEMDISELSEQASTSAASADASYVHGLKNIRGRRSYKPLGEFVMRTRTEKPVPLTDETDNWNESEDENHYEDEVDLRIQGLYHWREAVREENEQRRAEEKKWREALQAEKAAVEAASRPTVHVVGRKRKPLDEDDFAPHTTGEESVTVKRMRLLDRVVSPFASLVRRRAVVSSSTPLPARRSQPIVGINTDLPLHGPIGVEPEILPQPDKADVLKLAPAELPTAEPAVEAREDSRQKCAVM